MKKDKRLERLEGYLTPKQAVLVWMEETHQHRNIHEYIKYMKTVPEDMRPIPRLTTQVENAIRKAMVGYPKQTIEAQVKKAERDVIFLIKLHDKVNTYFLEEERVWNLILLSLDEKLRSITWQGMYQHLLKRLIGCSAKEMPYPVDPDMAAAIDAAIKNHVTTWFELEDAEVFDGWLREHYLDKGAVEFPEGSYTYDDDGKCIPQVTEDNEQAIRNCFKDEAEFERFKNGEDYTKGLASVKDAEYNRHYNQMVSKLKKVATPGTSLYLEEVPIPFLRDLPLIEGEWIDRHVIELAELGALLKAKGYQPTQTDEHPLAWPRYKTKGGSDLGRAELAKLRSHASRRLYKYPGRNKQIAGRQYISFQDYNEWSERKLEGDLTESLYPGVLTASWNAKFGFYPENKAGGVAIPRINCLVKEGDYSVNSSSVERRLEKRASMLAISNAPEARIKRELEEWKQTAELWLGKLFADKEAVAVISNRYFDENEVLLDDYRDNLNQLEECVDRLVAVFNGEAGKMGLRNIEIKVAIKVALSNSEARQKQSAYLVDMAKAESLDVLGEERQAMEIAERHVSCAY